MNTLPTPALSLSGVTLYGLQAPYALNTPNRPLIEGLNLNLKPGQWLSVVGANGVGKSTLLRSMAGAVPPDAGAVLLNGKSLQELTSRERARRIGFLGQSVYPAQSARVYDIVMLGRLPWQGWFAAPSAADHEAVMQALHTTDIAALSCRDWQTLSGGEVQRVLIARSLATQASIWLHDEPLANLDPQYQMAWVDAVRAHCARGGVVVSVLHELHIALLANEVLLVQTGGVTQHGTPSTPHLQRQIEAAFGHRVAIQEDGQIRWGNSG
jgi:iron complex transport system ATP-binding protein